MPRKRGAITEHRGLSFICIHPLHPRIPFSRAHANETSLFSMVATRTRSRGHPSHSLSSVFFLDVLRFFASSARTLSRSISMIAA